MTPHRMSQPVPIPTADWLTFESLAKRWRSSAHDVARGVVLQGLAGLARGVVTPPATPMAAAVRRVNLGADIAPRLATLATWRGEPLAATCAAAVRVGLQHLDRVVMQ